MVAVGEVDEAGEDGADMVRRAGILARSAVDCVLGGGGANFSCGDSTDPNPNPNPNPNQLVLLRPCKQKAQNKPNVHYVVYYNHFTYHQHQ